MQIYRSNEKCLTATHRERTAQPGMNDTMLVKMYSTYVLCIWNMKPPSRFVVPGGIPQMSSSSSQVVNLGDCGMMETRHSELRIRKHDLSGIIRKSLR